MNKFKSVFDVDGLLLKVCPVQLGICEFVNNFRTRLCVLDGLYRVER